MFGVGGVAAAATPFAVAPTAGVGATGSALGIQDTEGAFANQLLQGLEQVQGMQSTSDNLAVQAATGDLTDVHEYTVASTQASLATELTVVLRNKAVDAFTEIMRMQI